MYEYIKGTFISCYDDIVVIEAGGIGYCVFVPYEALDKLEKLGSEIKLYLSYVVKEDSQRFFGFRTEEERKLFEAFHAINGVGPKSALSIITRIACNDLYAILAAKDIDSLVKIPGVGKKTASRIVLEMADKLEDVKIPKSRGPNIIEDAILALDKLGIQRSEAYHAVKKVESPDLKLPALIKKALATITTKTLQ